MFSPETQNILLDSAINGVILVFFWYVLKNYVKGIEGRFDKLIHEIQDLRKELGEGQVGFGKLEERLKTAFSLIKDNKDEIKRLRNRVENIDGNGN